MTSLLSNSRRPDVTFYERGKIDISSRIAKQLSLADGDAIDVVEHRGEYLLYVRQRRDDIIGRHEGVVHAINNNKSVTNRFRVYSRKLTEAIFRVVGLQEDTTVLRLPAGQPVEVVGIGAAIPLITRKPI